MKFLELHMAKKPPDFVADGTTRKTGCRDRAHCQSARRQRRRHAPQGQGPGVHVRKIPEGTKQMSEAGLLVPGCQVHTAAELKASVENWRKRMARINPLCEPTEEDRRRFYLSLLGVRWLPLEIKDAVLAKGLGISVSAQNACALAGWARQTAFNIALRVRLLAENKAAGPKGGLIGKAKAAEAKSQGITVAAMERRLEGLGASQLHAQFLNGLKKAKA
jgi:hypothetical protein